MLIQFKTSNFRSIKGEVALSLAASNYDKSLPENLIDPGLPRLPKAKLLKGAAIYGPNASGKSNILSALGFMKWFVLKSATKIGPGDPTGTIPFCLDQEYLAKASEFEITAVINGVRYVYGFAVDPQRVRHEYLTAYPKGSAQKWFDRRFNAKTGEYSWEHSEAFFKLDKDLKEKTRPNCLFVSIGAQFNNAQLTGVYTWFRRWLQVIDLSAESVFHGSFTTKLIDENEEKAKAVLALIQSADMGIAGADIQRKDLTLEQMRKRLPAEIASRLEAPDSAKWEEVEVRFKHRNSADGGATAIDFSEESAGTRRVYALAGPWLDIIENGYTVVIDEFETSLHPLLVRELLKLLSKSSTNQKGAQVIFSTHSPILLDQELLRRDQIWFTEKDQDGATKLYPLTDYKPRNNESLTRGYLAGRYGAIPFIPDGLALR